MRKLVRALFLVCFGLLFSTQLGAHVLTWWGNPSGLATTTPLSFIGGQFGQLVQVAPEAGEPCWVQVAVNDQTSPSPLIRATVVTANPANVVQILVQVLRSPVNHLETATVTGSWAATGYPPLNNCDGASTFSVPVTVSDQPQMWQYNLSIDNKWLNLDARVNTALMRADWITGPWKVIGVGQKFTVPTDMPYQGFVRGFDMGGYVGGRITDRMGSPLLNYKITFPYGGDMAVSDISGTYNFPDREPAGTEELEVTDGDDDGAELDVEAENTNNVTLDWFVDVEVDEPVTNICNCTPWAAIGFGNGAGGQTPVYYSGGANGPKTGPATCDEPVVTVTPPSGKSFTITPGTRKRQSSGADPASGTWTVSATVCGQTKSATVDVP